MCTHLGTVSKLKHSCACGKQMDLSFRGQFIMAALHSRCGHYIFALWFFLLSFFLSFFPCLISVVADWMSTILPHMVWP